MDAEPFAVAFTVPGAPRGKGRPRTAVRGRHAVVYTDAKTRSEEGAVRMFASSAMEGKDPYQGAVVLRLCAYYPIPSSMPKGKRVSALAGALAPVTKPDADNVLKLLGDGLNGVIWRDDSQIVTAVVHKRYSDQPRLVVDVRAWPEQGTEHG